jgi:hypothetical protein
MSLISELYKSVQTTVLYKRARAAIYDIKGQGSQRDALITAIAVERLQNFATRKAVSEATNHPERKTSFELVAYNFGFLWGGINNHPSEAQKQAILKTVEPIKRLIADKGVAMDVSVINGYGDMSGIYPAKLQAAFRPTQQAQKTSIRLPTTQVA